MSTEPRLRWATRLGHRRTQRVTRQRGTSLVIVLLILIIVSMLGVAAARMSMMAERSTRNDRDMQIAWQSAEAALVDAQFDIRGTGTPTPTRADAFATGNVSQFLSGCGTSGSQLGLCVPTSSGKPVWLNVDLGPGSTRAAQFGAFTGRSFDSSEATAGLKPSRRPRYIIEALPDPEIFGNKDIRAPRQLIYRITAMGFGPRDDIQAVVQTVFRKE